MLKYAENFLIVFGTEVAHKRSGYNVAFVKSVHSEARRMRANTELELLALGSMDVKVGVVDVPYCHWTCGCQGENGSWNHVVSVQE